MLTYLRGLAESKNPTLKNNLELDVALWSQLKRHNKIDRKGTGKKSNSK